MIREKDLPTLYWRNRNLYLIDQRYLPGRIAYRICKNCEDVVASIREMTVRGAPAIGISAAFGLVIEANNAFAEGADNKELYKRVKSAGDALIDARPTAVNLSWAVDRMTCWLDLNINLTTEELLSGLEKEALLIYNEDLENNRSIGRLGADLVPQQANILTHCNAGALATGGHGTALGVIRTANELGKDIHVFVDETRPLLQGARLTAFELLHEGIPATLITDSCAGYLMATGRINLVIVGADRIAANGDTANKIGTYSLAVLSNYHRIPFYIAAPLSTIDLAINNGKEIIIEERCCTEVTHFESKPVAAAGVKVFNPAFDVTPAELITAIITEKGLVKQPTNKKIKDLFNDKEVV
jgi:methylthioribose-1-phosphate isomerase